LPAGEVRYGASDIQKSSDQFGIRSTLHLESPDASTTVHYFYPRAVGSGAQVEQYSLSGLEISGFGTPEEVKQWAHENRRLKPGQARYLLATRAVPGERLRSALGSDYARTLHELKLAELPTDDGSWVDVKASAVRIVAGQEFDADGKPRELALPHFPAEKLAELEKFKLEKLKLTEGIPKRVRYRAEIGRLRSEGNGLSQIEIKLAIWAIGVEAAARGIAFDQVDVLVWTRGDSRNGHYATEFGIETFAQDLTQARPEYWAHTTLADASKKLAAIELTPHQWVRGFAPGISQEAFLSSRARFIERSRPRYELGLPGLASRPQVLFGSVGASLYALQRSWLHELNPSRRAESEWRGLPRPELDYRAALDPHTGFKSIDVFGESLRSEAAREGLDHAVQGLGGSVGRLALQPERLASLLLATFAKSVEIRGGVPGKVGLLLKTLDATDPLRRWLTDVAGLKLRRAPGTETGWAGARQNAFEFLVLDETSLPRLRELAGPVVQAGWRRGQADFDEALVLPFE
jgi:hypothetical protein